MKILCVCAQGQHRSKIAAEILSEKGHSTRYGGIDSDAPHPVKEEDVAWAEAFVFARGRHQELFHKRYGVKSREVVLEVTDKASLVPEIWRRVLVEDPDRFYTEFTLPLIREALDGVTFK